MIPVCFHSPDVPVISFAGIKDILFYIIPDPPGEQLFRYFVAKIRVPKRARMQICRAESVPFAQYRSMMAGCDVLLDQLYSYTPAMNYTKMEKIRRAKLGI